MRKFVRFEYEGKIGCGELKGDRIEVLDRNFLDREAKPTGETIDAARVRLLAPVDAPNIVCIGLNYKSHAEEADEKLPEIPLIFLKATTALCGHGDAIRLPRIAPNNVDYEGELAIVIGRRCKDVSEAEALDYVFGYTIANDVSARDCQLKIDKQWARGKSFDTFCPVGPCVAADIDASNVAIETRMNGRVMQSSNTGCLIFPIPRLVSFISQNMTLLPGTIILTGTPEGCGFKRVPPVWLRGGDVVEVSIENIGTLVNRVEGTKK